MLRKDEEEQKKAIPPLNTAKVAKQADSKLSTGAETPNSKTPKSPINKFFNLFKPSAAKEVKDTKVVTQEEKRKLIEKNYKNSIEQEGFEREFDKMMNNAKKDKERYDQYHLLKPDDFKRRSRNLDALLKGAPVAPEDAEKNKVNTEEPEILSPQP